MKEITCIQQYVIDNLIKNKTLSIENLIDVIVKTCSTEQFNNILSILIKEHASCTNKDKVNFKIMQYNNLPYTNTIMFRQLNMDLQNTKSSVASIFICEYRYTSCTHKAAFTWRVC